MTRINTLLIVLATLLFSFNSSAQRYTSEIFSDVTITHDVQYANNITIITGAPAPENLLMDVYEPTGDAETERPVVLVAHGGEYLPPPLNGLTYGEKSDSAVVHLCSSLAKRGFVAISYQTRLGWNPNGVTQEDRTGTYLNAFYRATQDGFSVIRYLRMDADSQGNTFGIDTTRIISGGLGTGGQISSAMAFLDRHEELELPKFLDLMTLQSYIDTSLSANVYGTLTRPLNVANNPSYSNEFHFAFNVGGYVGDSSWIEPGDVPMVSMASPTDPFSPIEFGASIIRTTGDFLINCSGSKGIQQRQQSLGNNLSFSTVNYSDPYSTQANLINDGIEGYYPFYRPAIEDAPWNYWDTVTWNIPHPSGGTFNENGMLTNPDMSITKGKTYLDTVVNYLCPRIVCALNLAGCPNAGLNENNLQDAFTVYPNPSMGAFTVLMDNGPDARTIRISDFSGKLLHEEKTNGQKVELELDQTGIFTISVYSKYGVSHRKIVIQ